MNRFGILILLLALGVQSTTLHLQRFVVAGPFELAPVKVSNDVEVEESLNRFQIDLAIDSAWSPSASCFVHCRSFPLFPCQGFPHLSDAHFLRGPPAV